MHQLNSIFFKKLFLGGGFLCLKKTSGNFRIEMAENAPNHNHMCFTRLSGLCVLDLYVYYIKFNLLFNKNNQQSTAIPPSMHGLGSLYIAINKNGDFGGRNPPLLLKICKSNNQCILSFPILIVLKEKYTNLP
jgi:hypothetical protein